NLLYFCVQVILSNGKLTNVHVGPALSIRPVREQQYSPSVWRFVEKCKRCCYPLVGIDGGFWWPGFRERLIEGHLPDDNSLVSILKSREEPLYQRAISLLEKQIALFGQEVASL